MDLSFTGLPDMDALPSFLQKIELRYRLGGGLESVLADVRYALRQLGKNPGFAITAVMVLALGMAGSIAIFAFVESALVEPLPYREPARLVSVFRSDHDCRDCGLAYLDYLDFRKYNTAFGSLDALEITVHRWKSAGGVKAMRAARVSGGFFRTLGVSAILGRVFAERDNAPEAPRTVVLPFATWQNRFGGRLDVVGRSIVLDDEPYVVIGVLPSDFHFALRAAELWTTIHDFGECGKTRWCHSVYGVGRLRDGVSIGTAAAEMRALAARLAKEYPDSDSGQSAIVLPLSDAIRGQVRPTLMVLLGSAGPLLLIACVNVAGLLLVRAENGRRETAVRLALGASAARLIRLYVMEGVLIAGCAVLLGLMADFWMIPRLFALIPERSLRGMPFFQGVGLHAWVLVFAGGVVLLAVVLCSLMPALWLWSSNLRGDLAEGGRGSTSMAWRRFGSNLVAVELAIAMVLLASAGLLEKSLYSLLDERLSFLPDRIATLEMDITETRYNDGQLRNLSKGLINRVSALPGVVAAAHTNELPPTCNCRGSEFRVVGHAWDGQQHEVLKRNVSADYFKVLRARLLRGRWLRQEDDEARQKVVLINQTLAREFFAGEDPIGRVVGDGDLSPASLRHIVGVVEDIREGTPGEPLEPALYSPFLQNPEGGFFLAVRTKQDAEGVLPMLEMAIQQADPDIGVRNEFTMAQRIDNAAFLHRSSASLVGGFAVLALLLGVIGLYGAIAYSVSRRTGEIGVRMALGAGPGAVYGLILGEAGFVAGIGIAIGLVCSAGAAVLLRSLLFGVNGWDVPTVMAIAVVLEACAVAGSYLPARKAASVNPVEALRAD